MRKLLQNTFFAAMLAWALQCIQTHLENASVSGGNPIISSSTLKTQVAWHP